MTIGISATKKQSKVINITFDAKDLNKPSFDK